MEDGTRGRNEGERNAPPFGGGPAEPAHLVAGDFRHPFDVHGQQVVHDSGWYPRILIKEGMMFRFVPLSLVLLLLAACNAPTEPAPMFSASAESESETGLVADAEEYPPTPRLNSRVTRVEVVGDDIVFRVSWDSMPDAQSYIVKIGKRSSMHDLIAVDTVTNALRFDKSLPSLPINVHGAYWFRVSWLSKPDEEFGYPVEVRDRKMPSIARWPWSPEDIEEVIMVVDDNVQVDWSTSPSVVVNGDTVSPRYRIERVHVDRSGYGVEGGETFPVQSETTFRSESLPEGAYYRVQPLFMNTPGKWTYPEGYRAPRRWYTPPPPPPPPPVTTSTAPPKEVVLTPGGSAAYDVSAWFKSDSYTASSSAPSIVRAEMSGAVLTVTGLKTTDETVQVSVEGGSASSDKSDKSRVETQRSSVGAASDEEEPENFSIPIRVVPNTSLSCTLPTVSFTAETDGPGQNRIRFSTPRQSSNQDCQYTRVAVIASGVGWVADTTRTDICADQFGEYPISRESQYSFTSVGERIDDRHNPHFRLKKTGPYQFNNCTTFYGDFSPDSFSVTYAVVTTDDEGRRSASRSHPIVNRGQGTAAPIPPIQGRCETDPLFSASCNMVLNVAVTELNNSTVPHPDSVWVIWHASNAVNHRITGPRLNSTEPHGRVGFRKDQLSKTSPSQWRLNAQWKFRTTQRDSHHATYYPPPLPVTATNCSHEQAQCNPPYQPEGEITNRPRGASVRWYTLDAPPRDLGITAIPEAGGTNALGDIIRSNVTDRRWVACPGTANVNWADDCEGKRTGTGTSFGGSFGSGTDAWAVRFYAYAKNSNSSTPVPHGITSIGNPDNHWVRVDRSGCRRTRSSTRPLPSEISCYYTHLETLVTPN